MFILFLCRPGGTCVSAMCRGRHRVESLVGEVQARGGAGLGGGGQVTNSGGNHEAVWQQAGYQGAWAPVLALGVPRCNHLHLKCSSVPPDHLGHVVGPLYRSCVLWVKPFLYRSTISEIYLLLREVSIESVSNAGICT